jgi:hypothetical protein
MPYFSIKQLTMRVADVNGDSHPDIAVGNYGSSNVEVLKNAGDGTLLNHATYIVRCYPFSLEVFDVNGDNHPDIVAANGLSDNISVQAYIRKKAYCARKMKSNSMQVLISPSHPHTHTDFHLLHKVTNSVHPYQQKRE